MLPVPPTQSNWQVHRAWLDGASDAFTQAALFFNLEAIQAEEGLLVKKVEKAQKQQKPLQDDPLRLA